MSKLSSKEVEDIILNALKKVYRGYDYRRIVDGMYINVKGKHICTTYIETKTRNDYAIPSVEKANLITILNQVEE